MNIGKAAKLSNLTVKTVRYYADIGLVSPVKNSKTGYRDFSEDDVARLQFVSKARKFNFTIQECEELLSLYSDKDRSSREVKSLTLEKISEIDAKLFELKDLGNNSASWQITARGMIGQMSNFRCFIRYLRYLNTIL